MQFSFWFKSYRQPLWNNFSTKMVERKSPFSITKTGDILIQILAKPGAKQNKITGIEDGEIGVQIHASPTEGAANAELLRYISKIVGVRSSDISLIKGMRSRDKVLMISKKSCTIEELERLIKAEME